jgi:hypothetical protein
MAIAGKLTDFPLPEVLLLIGSRTGRLRLFEVPEIDDLELELSEGYAHALNLSGSCLDEDREIITQLSLVVAQGEGQFEFTPETDISYRREHPLPINNLVILMVVYVDEVLNRPSEPVVAEPIYKLEPKYPEIEIDPSLNAFFKKCQPLLMHGARSEDLSALVGMRNEDVRLNLAYLRQLGFIQIVETSETAEEIRLEQSVTQKSAELRFAAEASDLIRRSGKLFKITLGQSG